MKRIWMLVIGLCVALLASTISVADQTTIDKKTVKDIVILDKGSTDDMFGGGNYIMLKARDVRFGVLYGNESNPNFITLFADYKRYLGGAEIYDNQDNFIRKIGIPIQTILAQKFEFMFEFYDMNHNGLFEFYRSMDENGLQIIPIDMPIKALSLNKSWKLEKEPEIEVIDDKTMNVNFTLSITNVLYDKIWTGYGFREGVSEDGNVSKIAFIFHITIKIESYNLIVPWYKVNVANGNERVVTHSEQIENRNYTGKAINATFKYDHYIEGWDFASKDSKLALETKILAGNFISKPVAKWLRKQFGNWEVKYLMDGKYKVICDEKNLTPILSPIKITRDKIHFEDNWYRIGSLMWASNVTVDGKEETMVFQVHFVNRTSWIHAGNIFAGLSIRGGFIYPAGNKIFHDPVFSSIIAFEFDIPTITNLLPFKSLVVQLSIATAAAASIGVYVFKKRKGKIEKKNYSIEHYTKGQYTR